MKYRWHITRDHIKTGAKGKRGPGAQGTDFSIKGNKSHFVMEDDDGVLYYEGEIFGDYTGFEPLHEFGMLNASCTTIFYKGKAL